MPTLAEQIRALSEDYKAGILTREEFDAAKADLIRSGSDPGRGAAAFGQAPPAPQRIAEYRVLRRLGAGGMGTVYLAENMIEGLARREGRVAIKVIHRHLVAEPGIRERFLAEAQNSTVIDHPNLVRVHRYLPDHDALVMEYVEGASLATVLARSRPDWEAAVSAFQGVLDAVAAFHGRRPPIVHRDLKPGNIMVSASGPWKVMDFGLARDLGGVGTGTSSHDALGTLAYMPPEQAARPKEVDPRWDVYALGLVLWEILTGSAAWRQVDSGYQLLMDKAADKVLDLAVVPEGIPRGLVLAVLKACRANPVERYPNAGAMCIALGLAFRKVPVGLDLMDSVLRPGAPWMRPNLAVEADPRREPEPKPPVCQPPVPVPPPAPIPQPTPPAPRPAHAPHQADPPTRNSKGVAAPRGGHRFVGGVAVIGAVIALAVAVSRNGMSPHPSPSVLPEPTPTVSLTPTGRMPTSSPANPAGINWVSVPAGSFSMGSNSGEADERPVHAVTLRAFEMSRTEVTIGQYEACVEARACQAAHTDDGTCFVDDGSGWGEGTLPTSCRGQKQPVVCVDWFQATAFAQWAGGRLPSEAEWEYAAKAGQNTVYAGSEDATEVAWHSDNAGGATHPVGQKKANAWGLYDMSGNVSEWVQDGYHGSYAGAPTNGKAWESPVGSLQVVRSGSWFYRVGGARVANRGRFVQAGRSSELGLRLVRYPEP